MKKTAVYKLIAFGMLWFMADFWQGCKPKKEDSQVTPTPNTSGNEQPKLYFITAVNSTSNDIGLLINDPAAKEQMVVFGKKNTSGNLTAITHLMQIAPETKLWVLHEFSDNQYPKKSIFSSGQELVYSDYNSTKKTFSVKALESKTSAVLWERKEIPLDANFFTTISEYQKRAISLKGGRSSATIGLTTTPTAGEAAYIGANAFGCVLGAAGLGAAAAVGGLVTPMFWFGAYNTWQNCKGAYEAANNLRNGEPAFGCMTQDDIINSASGYGESIINFALVGGPGALGNFVTGMVPAMMANAIQAGSCAAASARSAGGTANDPVISGLDGNKILLHPAGEFLAIRSKNDEFAAQVRFEPVGTRMASTTTSMAIRTGKDVVSFTVKPLTIHVNGQEIKADFSNYLLQDKAYLTRPAANRYEIVTTWGDMIEVRVLPTFNISWYVRHLNDKRKNQVEGLLGQFNDNPDDDFKDKAGNVYTVGKSPRTDFYKKFAHDWRLTQTESLLFYPTGKTTESYTKLEFPEKALSLFDFDLADRTKAEQTCRTAGIGQDPDLSDCMLDVLATGMNEMADQMALGIKLRDETVAMFQRKTPFPGEGREGAIIQTIGTKIYVGLGLSRSDWYAYDPANDSWTKKADFPVSTKGWYAAAPFVIGDKLYLAGGINGNDLKRQNTLWEYNSSNDQWTQRKNLPGPERFNAAGFAVGGKGYVVFGSIGWGLGQADYPTNGTLYEYDPMTDSWATRADHPSSRGGTNITNREFNGLVVNINGRPFVNAGGNAPYEQIYGWYEYVPGKNTWETRSKITAGSQRYFSIGNKAYFLSGEMERGKLMEYDATTDTWTKYPGKEIYIPFVNGADNAGYSFRAAALNGIAYFGIGAKSKEWWSFTP